MHTPGPAFADLGVPEPMIEQLDAQGITHAFPIQAAVIPDALAGRDVAGQAPTGSGKTLAFGIPLIAGLGRAGSRRPRALVLSPTRELADQIADEVRPLAATSGQRVVALYGGVGYGPQLKALGKGAEVVVACPGRLEDLLGQDALTLEDVEVVVVDEADRMADMGFLPAVRRILTASVSRRQTLLFSATLDGPVSKLVEEFQDDPRRHVVGSTEPDLASARHLFWLTDRMARTERTAEIVTALGPTMVFCRTRRRADRLARQLGQLGVTATPLHGGRSQPQRNRALQAFADGAVQSLIVTDVAARGIHIDGVAGVLHFDLAEDRAAYVHRSGRTARAGATGTVVSLVDPDQLRDARTLQRTVGLDEAVTDPDVPSLRSAPQRPQTTTAKASGRRAAPARATTPTAEPKRTARRAEERKARRRANAGAESTMEKGTVKFFRGDKGYGFIARTSEPDLFVHHTALHGEGRASLSEGQRVQFEIGRGRKGPEARNVRVV